MGSEWLIIGYGIIGFLFVLLFRAFFKNQSQREDLYDKSVDKKVGLFSMGVQILCVSILILSTIGMAKGVIESYDNCGLKIVNETVSGNTTTYDYDNVCVDNSNSSDESMYSMTFMILYVFILLFIVSAVWNIGLFIMGDIWPRIKNKLLGRRRR